MDKGRRVTDEIAVSPEISAEDVADIAAAGYRSMICNRPDGEGLSQTAFATIEAAAMKHGLKIAWQPVVGNQITDEDGARFGELVAELPGPVYAYCRSGTRCMVLWALSQAPHMRSDEIVRHALEVGYDLRGFEPRLDAIFDAAGNLRGA